MGRNAVNAESRLRDLGFSAEDLVICSAAGFDPERVLDSVNNLMEQGLTSEHYARETFQEAHPEAFCAAPDGEPRYKARLAAEFGEDNTSFVWYPYLPIGDYTVLMAPGGTGKTYFVCGIAAAVSKGLALPGDLKPEKAGNVLLISAEDRGELLKRRLMASGADLERVYILDCMSSVGLNFTEGYETFRETIGRYSPRLVVVDPWHGFVGENVDLNRVNAVRPIFQRLANIAKEYQCGMILVSHVNKRAQGENVNNAATGSTDFINASRSALYIIFDEENEDRRIVVHTKSNYARYGQSVCFAVEDGGIVWDGFSEIDRQTMEQAARQRKTPFEVNRVEAYRDSTKETLLRAMGDAAIPFSDVKFTYDSFKDKYGSEIFGTMQPKRLLDSVASDLYARGYQLKTGIQVQIDGVKKNGFLIHPIGDYDGEKNDQEELPL